MSSIAQADREGAERRAKGANLVFLNIPKLDALKARPGEHRTEYWDRALHGFGGRVYANGRKIFTVQYTLHGDQRRRDVGVSRRRPGRIDAREVDGGEQRLPDNAPSCSRVLRTRITSP